MPPPRAGEERGPIARSCGARRAGQQGGRAAGRQGGRAARPCRAAWIARSGAAAAGWADILPAPPPPPPPALGRGLPARAGEGRRQNYPAPARRLRCAGLRQGGCRTFGLAPASWHTRGASSSLAPGAEDMRFLMRPSAMPMPSQYTTLMPRLPSSSRASRTAGRPAGPVPLPDSMRRPARGSASGWSRPAGPVPPPDSMAHITRAMSPPRHPLSTQCRLCGALPRTRRCRMRPRTQTAPRKERRPGGACSGAGRRGRRAETRTGACAGRRQAPWPRSRFPAGHRRAGPKWSARCHRRGGRPSCAPNAVPVHCSARQTPCGCPAASQTGRRETGRQRRRPGSRPGRGRSAGEGRQARPAPHPAP